MRLNEHQRELFKELTELNGISGMENEVAAYLKRKYEELGYSLLFDNLGSIFALKKSKVKDAPKVMVVAHMDEVGFMVINIEENGMIKAQPIGGINEETLLSSRVLLKKRDGSYLNGAIGAIPPHLLKNAGNEKTKVKDMLFDFGFTSREDAIDNGAYIGAMMVLEGKFCELNDGKRILAKAIDDRYGLVLGLEILELFKDRDLPFDLYVGGSVQEEVGCRGALTSSHLIKPDLAIVLDCSPARDSSGNKNELGQLGQGVLIRFVDGSMIAFKELLDMQVDACIKSNVPYQYFNSPGGTDAGNIHKNLDGILTLTHCICARSIHTPSTIFDVTDYFAARESLIYMLEHFDSVQLESLKKVRQ